ncbi:NUMOD4 motif-containing HNH endonuclease [Tabrizicola sp. M-4]|uniref:NUMOD4 motif-containing HNH endonuclease n=1 Tax=Tabrizicola sp. M-4 TaxID=3055847 RepID=UPI003DA91D15
MEVWKDVPGFEGAYSVSSLGKVRSLDRTVRYTDGRVAFFKGVLFDPVRGAQGYLGVTLRRDGKSHRRLIHQIVAAAFLGPKPDWADCVNHKNGDKTDNRFENLEWVTLADNNRHARATGLLNQRGENCNLTVYPDALVSALRRVHERYRPTYSELSLLFDMPQSTVSQIVRNLSRK